MILFLIAIFGAFINRCRGGLISILTLKPNKYDWVGRFGQPIFFAIMVWFLLGSLPASILVAVGMFLGQTFSWGNYTGAIFTGKIDDERVDIALIDKIIPKDYDNPKFWGVKCLSLRGLLWSFWIVAPLVYFAPQALWILPIGLTMGVVYYLSRTHPIAEYVWGAIIWSATYLILQ